VSWLPEGFVAPARLELSTGEHLRPIRTTDIDVDYATVMANQPHLWETFGEVWNWPPPDLTRQQDLDDLVRHVEEMERNESFNYAIFSASERVLRGCVYIDPPERAGADADICWWVARSDAGSALDEALRTEVPTWIAEEWPFAAPRFVGVGMGLTWARWKELPAP
jgi:hypothetical protein